MKRDNFIRSLVHRGATCIVTVNAWHLLEPKNRAQSSRFSSPRNQGEPCPINRVATWTVAADNVRLRYMFCLR
jgi:hypothetical protein